MRVGGGIANSSGADEYADDDAGGEELNPGWQSSGAVPPVETVGGEELPAARLGQREDVLEVTRVPHEVGTLEARDPA